MRDIMWLTYWTEHDHRRYQYMRGEYGGIDGVATGIPVNGPPGAAAGGVGGGKSRTDYSHNALFSLNLRLID